MTQAMKSPRVLTGWHVLAGFVTAFGIIIAVNLWMAYSAVSTFPGLEVENSYVASQEFDDKRLAQEALNWTLSATYDAGELVLNISDPQTVNVQAQSLKVLVGRATTVEFDTYPQMHFDGTNYRAPMDLGAGNWLVKVDAVSQSGVVFQQRLDVYVRG